MNARHFFFLAILLVAIPCCKIVDYTSDRSRGEETVPPVPDIYDDRSEVDASNEKVVNYRLPDGYLLKIKSKNKTDDGIAETADGFSIMLNPEGFYEYTIKDDQGLSQPTGIIARNPEDRTTEEWRILNSIP